MLSRLKYHLTVIRWMWKHRDERDCRQKWKRMDRELKGAGYNV